MRRWLRAGAAAYREATRKGVALVAAGVAFYMLLAIFPGVALAVTITGLFLPPESIELLIADLEPFAPEGAIEILRERVEATLAAGAPTLGATAIVSFVLTLWSAGAATRALLSALHLAFPRTHDYGYLVFLLLSFALTLAAICMIALAVAILLFLPIGFRALREIEDAQLFQTGLDFIAAFEPLILLGLASLVLTMIYRWGAIRGRAPLRSAFAAAVLTTIIWIAASRLLGFYIADFADLGAVYGPFGAMAGLMLWFWISAYLLLLGVELTAALSDERATVQTKSA